MLTLFGWVAVSVAPAPGRLVDRLTLIAWRFFNAGELNSAKVHLGGSLRSEIPEIICSQTRSKEFKRGRL